MTGLDSKLSSRLSLSGHVGIGFVNSYQTGQSSPLSVSNPGAIADLSSFGFVAPFQPQVGTGNSILADIALTYLLSRATTVSLTAAQAVVPTTFGALQKSDSVGLTLIHNINQRSNLSLSGSFSFVPAAPGGNSVFGGQSGESEFLSASINYGYSLTREWRTNLSYTYRQRNDDSGTVRSSTVLFSLSRDFALLGNPAAINEGEKERARERDRQSIGYIFPTLR